jgi:glycosyltransferase involved in cell wall biosynthesis
MYCGGQTDVTVCSRCLGAQPAFAGVDIAKWRERHRYLLQRAAFRIAPSRWSADMLLRYFPGCAANVIAHGAPDVAPSPADSVPAAFALPDDRVPTVAVLGAIGPDKGARRLERLVSLARARGAFVRFVLIGYMDVIHGPWQSDDALLTVHGRYEPAELAGLLAHYRVAVVLYPSAGPETFSYTLSEAWASGRPVLVPPIGALEERVRDSGAGWVMTDAEWRDERRMLERVLAVLGTANVRARDNASAAASAMPQASLRSMLDATFACYDAAVAVPRTSSPRPSVRPSLQPFAAARVRDALVYRPWTPPPQAATPVAPPRGIGGRVAQAAVAIRHKLPGRILYRMAPASLVERLKRHLG